MLKNKHFGLHNWNMHRLHWCNFRYNESSSYEYLYKGLFLYWTLDPFQPRHDRHGIESMLNSTDGTHWVKFSRLLYCMLVIYMSSCFVWNSIWCILQKILIVNCKLPFATKNLLDTSATEIDVWPVRCPMALKYILNQLN